MVTAVEEAARLGATAHTLDLTGSAKLKLMDDLRSLETMGPVRFKLVVVIPCTCAPYPTSSEARTKVGSLRCPLGLHPATERWLNAIPRRFCQFRLRLPRLPFSPALPRAGGH